MALNHMKDNLERRINLFRSLGGEVLLEIEYANSTKYENVPFETFDAFNSGPRVETSDIKRVKAYCILMQIEHSARQKSGDYHKMVVDWDLQPIDVSNLNAKHLLEYLKNREKAVKNSHISYIESKG